MKITFELGSKSKTVLLAVKLSVNFTTYGINNYFITGYAIHNQYTNINFTYGNKREK